MEKEKSTGVTTSRDLLVRAGPDDSQVVTLPKAKSILVVDSWLLFSLQRNPNWWWKLWHYLLLGWKFRDP
uniref:Uncharacterized protein n=1 Tax=viral metagenome TaxID=1070528 RepID=A0A6M3JDU3_9ZZZZ